MVLPVLEKYGSFKYYEPSNSRKVFTNLPHSLSVRLLSQRVRQFSSSSNVAKPATSDVIIKIAY